jgi:hypothetical protein
MKGTYGPWHRAMSPAAAGGAVAGRSLAAGPVGAELVTHAGLVGLAE